MRNTSRQTVVAASEKTGYTGTGGFVGGLAGGVYFGNALSASAVAICIAMGVLSAGFGTGVCAVVVVGAVSLGSGVLFEKFGEKIGESIYKAVR